MRAYTYNTIVHTVILFLYVSYVCMYVIQAADGKWGEDPEYKRYKKTVPVLIPFIGRAGNAAF